MPENVAQTTGDQWEVQVGGAQAPILAGLTLQVNAQLAAVLNQRTGSTPIAHKIDGWQIGGEITLNQWGPDIAALFVPVAGAAPRDLPGAGTTLTPTTLNFHDPHAADALGDLHFYQVVFGSIRTTNDGVGTKQFIVPFIGQMTTAGKTMRLGPAS